MFVGNQCFFGQCGRAQSHLKNMGVSTGDVFLFFGLFADESSGERHHSIFGFLNVEDMISGASVTASFQDLHHLPRAHPHTLGDWPANNTIYRGIGRTAGFAHCDLRLTQHGGPLCRWTVPTWLRDTGLSYHGNVERWSGSDQLEIVARGQEFVADIGRCAEPRRWLEHIMGIIEA
jgi:hypothetical protein